MVTLNKAMTIDTRAILQEKHKSYVYLTATTPSRDQEILGTGAVPVYVIHLDFMIGSHSFGVNKHTVCPKMLYLPIVHVLKS